MEDIELTGHLSRGIRDLVKDALILSLRKPSLALFLYRARRWQAQAATRRLEMDRRGLHVPAFMIVSVTRQCNLHCKGCYARAQHRAAAPDLSSEELRRLLRQANDLGISIALLAGGEPLVRHDLLDITADFPEMIFPVFTNGLLVNKQVAERLEAQKNVFPILSIEGHESETDGRRGDGVYENLLRTARALRRRSLLFGASVTVTHDNYTTVTSERFVRELLSAGARLVFFIEYVPVQEGTEGLCLSAEERAGLARAAGGFRRRLPGLFISFPGDEEASGGCVAAGRGFVHVGPDGSLEPCPFAPYSDVNVRHVPLRKALESRFLEAIRDNRENLRETRGGCALWEKRELVKELLPAPPLTGTSFQKGPAPAGRISSPPCRQRTLPT